ncbi:MAG TPA: alpha/beta hydrolase-fold protein [Gemmatimonadaceae bacterium]|nr:alpha/beta hydrolase-fold protein [Gemmatimonadaceae bacterium]
MRSTFFPLLAGVLMTAACTDRSATGPSLAGDVATARVTTPGTGPWNRVVEGETGPGSLYALYIPQNWNGEAIYYAHGIRPPVPYAPIALNDQDNFFEVRDALGALGYAFAYSSFSENGLAEKDGAQRTHQLRGLLTTELKTQPQRNYLAGYSLGALISMDIAEHHPGQYDGVLAMCGAVGGSRLELQYIGDVRALFDYYYPGVLPGNVISVPTPPMSVADLQARVIAAITPTATNPRATLGLFAIASTAQTPLAYAPVGSLADPTSQAFQSLVGSLITALYYQLLGTPDVLDRTHDHSPYANRGTTYTMGTPVVPAAALTPLIASMIAGSNAEETGVARYDSPPDAQNYLQNNYIPTGNISIPVVSVHNLWDPLVPFFHEPALATAATGAGSSGNLLQRAVPNYGHCNFPTPLVVSSFQTLADWVRTGVKPAS